MRRPLLLALALLGALAALGVVAARRARSKQPAPRPAVTGAAAVVERFQCYRCHDAPGKLVPAESRKHCVHCHQEILEGRLDKEYPADAIARWKDRIYRLSAVPSLTGIDRRLRRDWFEGFLRNPHDLRPDLPATMPRLAISEDDARTIADHFFSPSEPAAVATAGVATVATATASPGPPGDAARGRATFIGRGCGACHHFTGVGLPDLELPPRLEVRLAPDLRHARARLRPEVLDAWLHDPKALKPDTLMPQLGLSDEERRDLAAFVLEEPLAPTPPPAAPVRLPLLDRKVRYAEVESRVFKRICWHCHSDPLPVGGDGGPGNTGGFGFAGRGLDLGSHRAVTTGGHDASGARLDVLAKDASGVPLVVAAMLARHVEVGGGEVSGLLGMPLGLPPMTLEEIRLVDTWIAQGARADE